MRSAALLRKTKMSPESGSPRSPSRTRAARAVERLSEIRRLRREPDADGGRQAQHERPPWLRGDRRAARGLCGSNPAATRRHRPLARTISMPADRGRLDRLGDDVDGEECRAWAGRRSSLAPPPVERRLATPSARQNARTDEPAPPPSRQDPPPVRLASLDPASLGHGSPPFGHAPIVAWAARRGSPDAHHTLHSPTGDLSGFEVEVRAQRSAT